MHLIPMVSGQPSIDVPARSGMNSYFSGDTPHDYTITTKSSTNPSAKKAANALAESPTPGPKNQTATTDGVVNNAGPLLTQQTNLVWSFRAPSPDPKMYTDIIVNFTISGQHEASDGFVMRYGVLNQNGSVDSYVTYGEGNAWKQGSRLVEWVADIMAGFAWGKNHQSIDESLSSE